MTNAYWCVLIAALMPYVWTGAAKLSSPGFDNKSPRIFLGELKGWGKRANWAQMNSFEAFPAFAAAVITGTLIGNIEPAVLDMLAVLFVVCRFLHGLFYIIDQDVLRSIVWIIGIGSWVSIFIMSA